MRCNSCSKIISVGEEQFFNNSYFCLDCYLNLTKEKEKKKWIYILSGSAIILLIGLGLLLYWILKK